MTTKQTSKSAKAQNQGFRFVYLGRKELAAIGRARNQREVDKLLAKYAVKCRAGAKS